MADRGRDAQVERIPDPSDGRAKIIRLTARGNQAQALGWKLINELEHEWAQRYGTERIATLRETLETITAEHHGTTPA
ncbi:MAG: hypothetical protein ACRDSS_10715 [Actinocrinis sp.]